MADYYHLIKNAVARLDASAPIESRRALYERARTAQLTQLRSLRPSLSENEITCEQLALEEAVRKVEAEAAAPARDVRVSALRDLVRAADDIGKPIVHREDRPSIVLTKAPANPLSAAPAIETPPLMVSGGATGRLVRYWRWRALPPKSTASTRMSDR